MNNDACQTEQVNRCIRYAQGSVQAARELHRPERKKVEIAETVSVLRALDLTHRGVKLGFGERVLVAPVVLAYQPLP